MRLETICRYPERREVFLTAYLLDSVECCAFADARPALLICPGGGFSFCSDREMEPIAMHFASQGYQTFVLQYSLEERAAFPAPVEDAAWAVRTIREGAGRFQINPAKVAVMGFSAGGYVAAGLGVFSGEPWACPQASCFSARPDAVVLCYPVLTANPEYAHAGSIQRLIGTTPDTPQRRARLSLEEHIPLDMPPVFLWHTVDDPGVPVQNSLLFATALAQKGIPFELHAFETGHHGLADASLRTCDRPHPHAARWLSLAQEWLGEHFDFYPNGA